MPQEWQTAMELSKKNKTTTIIEKDKQVGGMAKTLVFKEDNYTFRTDIGPHRFFSKNKYLYDFIEGLLEEKWISVERYTRQFIKGKYYDYPIKAGQAFRNIGIFGSIAIILSYIKSIIVFRIFKKKVRNLEDYLVANFGYKLASLNMLNYTEKIWGIPCSQIHKLQGEQRIKGLSLTTAVKNALQGKSEEEGPKTLVDKFFYPQYGAGLVYETIAKKIEAKGHNMHLNSYPTCIKCSNNKISKVTVLQNGEEISYYPENLITSIPLTDFVELLSPQPPKKVMKAIRGLK